MTGTSSISAVHGWDTCQGFCGRGGEQDGRKHYMIFTFINYRHTAIQASLDQNAGNTLKSNEITRQKRWRISNMLQMITAINAVRPGEAG